MVVLSYSTRSQISQVLGYVHTAFGAISATTTPQTSQVDIYNQVRADLISAFSGFNTRRYVYNISWTVLMRTLTTVLPSLKEFPGNPPRRNYGYWSAGYRTWMTKEGLIIYENQRIDTFSFLLGNPERRLPLNFYDTAVNNVLFDFVLSHGTETQNGWQSKGRTNAEYADTFRWTLNPGNQMQYQILWFANLLYVDTQNIQTNAFYEL